MKVQVRIKRFDPERQPQIWWSQHELEAEPSDRVLDLLDRIKWEQDGGLTFRRSCAHGICGSDAMQINGRNQLACKALVKEAGPKITIEPLRAMRVIKDLVVDLQPFFGMYRRMKPYLINDEALPADGKERLQSPAQHLRYDDTTKCILCACCTSSCPSFWANPEYIGPQAIVQAHRFLFDSRDRASAERLSLAGDILGVWRCHTIFNCTQACPRGIKITQAIGEVKRAIATGRLD
ncbi:MAG: succinate dehydrogenase iron-sulfur subunit [Anaerolineales bacterium]|jgi:succinate dehydrogenase / fumarate reductase iron-sulfur subunit